MLDTNCARILVLSDSVGFGAELSDLPTKEFGPHGNNYWDPISKSWVLVKPSALAWPALLAKQLACEVDNLSLIGGSNDRIFRLAVGYTVSKQYDVIICAWTATDRLDLSYQEQDLAISLNAGWHRTFDWIKSFVDQHWDPVKADINFVTKLLTLQSFFADRQQKYLFVKSIPILLTPSALKLSQEIDTAHCVDWHCSMQQWAEHCSQGPGGHPLEQGHEIIADMIYRELEIRF